MIEGRPFAYPSPDGRALFGREWGDPSAPGLPLVCLPGLTRSSRSYSDFAAFLAARPRPRRIICLDFRGRGGSAWAPASTYSPLNEAADTAACLDHLGIPKAQFLGTSRGGLVMMVLALTRPGMMAGAVLNDVGPVTEAAGLVRIAGYVGVSAPPTWDALVAGLKASQGDMFPDLGDADWEKYARQINADDNGRPRLDYDPALAEAFKAFDPTTAKLPDFWPGFAAMKDIPTMVVHGALSDILSAATVAEMQARHPGLAVLTLPREGHAPLLWDTASQTAVADFLDGAAG